jgi:hypothetical protein
MTYPTWNTNPGVLATLTPGQKLQLNDNTVIQLNATLASSYSIISGTLPSGLYLNSELGYIYGVVIDPGITKSYSFVARASNSSGVDDIPLIITIASTDQPILQTPAGLLPLGLNSKNYILNHSPVNFQFSSTISALQPGTSLFYYIPEGGGSLPPGLTLSSTGLLSGIVVDQLDIVGNSITGTYDKDPFDIEPYDLGNENSSGTATTSINGTGNVTAVNLLTGGYGYVLDPVVIIGGSVDSVTINSGGSNYFTPPTILFSNPPVSGGVTATGYALLNAGSIIQINITNPGVGYVSSPTITIVSVDTGAGATATANLRSGTGAQGVAHISGGSIVRVDLVSQGSGYTIAPLVVFGNPTIGPKVVGKTYRFEVAVTNGQLVDTKTYSIAVDSENVLRSDSTFIQSDSVIYQADITYFQAPIWVTDNALASIRSNTNVEIKLQILDTTPNVGNIVYSLLDTNLDLSTSQLGPISTVTGKTFLNLDPVTGTIYGNVPYQPVITQTYNFTIKAARVVDDVEEIAALRQFNITLLGNIDSNITWTYPSAAASSSNPTLVGTLSPNQQSLLFIKAKTSLSNATISYQLVSGYGLNISDYVSGITISDANDKILISGVGYANTWQLIKGITYNIKIKTTNFSASIKQLNGQYYSTGLIHSDGSSGDSAQEKTSGFWIFHIPYTAPDNLTLYFTNLNKTGLIIHLKQYSASLGSYIDQRLLNFKDNWSASVYYQKQIAAGQNPIAIILTPNSLSWTVRKYANGGWQDYVPNYLGDQPSSPSDGDLWLDFASSSFGIFEEQSSGSGYGWVRQTPTFYTSVPSNSVGTVYSYAAVQSFATILIYRKNPNVGWTLVTIKTYDQLTQSDPTIFITDYRSAQPVSLNTHDIWFKYNERLSGQDLSNNIVFKTNGYLPTQLILTSTGNIVGKVSGILSYTYRAFYTADIFYNINDVVRYKSGLYISINNYRAAGNFTAELSNWQPFVFDQSINLSFDTHVKGINATQFNGLTTTFDNYLRFRARAYDSLNVSSSYHDFYIQFQSNTDLVLTNIYVQPFLSSTSRTLYRNFISDNTVFDVKSLFRSDDPAFGVQNIPKMLLLPGIQSTTADRYAGAVFHNFYNKKLVFSDLQIAIARDSDFNIIYEVIYVSVNDPSETVKNNKVVSVPSSIALDIAYDKNITSDYNKLRVDENDVEVNQTQLNTIYPSSISNMQTNLKSVQLTRTDTLLSPAILDNWGSIIDPILSYDDYGNILDLVTTVDDFMQVLQTLQQDDSYRPLWMNTSQDNTGVPIGYVTAVPICYCIPGTAAGILNKIKANGFDFKNLNFEIDRIIIEEVQGDTGAKYIKFANKDIV